VNAARPAIRSLDADLGLVAAERRAYHETDGNSSSSEGERRFRLLRASARGPNARQEFSSMVSAVGTIVVIVIALGLVARRRWFAETVHQKWRASPTADNRARDQWVVVILGSAIALICALSLIH
jgi:hypothetical protein